MAIKSQNPIDSVERNLVEALWICMPLHLIYFNVTSFFFTSQQYERLQHTVCYSSILYSR